MAKLQEFTSYIKTVGLMRNSRYTVEIASCKSMLGKYSAFNTSTVTFLCDQVQLPGFNYATQPNATFGETREIPSLRMYDNISLSFYVDNGMISKNYFDDWLFCVQDPIKRTFNYYNNYISDIIIRVEDLNNNTTYGVKLHEAYPKSVSSIQLDYSAKDVMKMNVNLAYKYWEPLPKSEYIYNQEPNIFGNSG